MLEPESHEKKEYPKIVFKKAYNNFDPKPLEEELLQNFYIEAISQSAVEELLMRIEITEQYRKLLLVGHRGCGKSTILNKIGQNLETHTVVAFSATDVVNISEIEAIDILLATYIKVLEQAHTIEDEKEKKKSLYLEKRNRFVKETEARAEFLLKKSKKSRDKGEIELAKAEEQEAYTLRRIQLANAIHF